MDDEISNSDPSGGTGTTTSATTTSSTTTSATTTATTATTATTTVTTPEDVDPPTEIDGFYINGTTLYDAKGNPFVMRGVNYSYTWFKDTAQVAIPQIAAYGANTVRIVLSNGEQWTKDSEAEVKALIELCEEYNLIAVLEVHDATGSNNKEDLLKAARYFVEIKNAFIGKEDRVIINIANEWFGEWSVDGWAQGHKEAIKVIRDAGLTHNIMVDAAGWGQFPASVHQRGKDVLNSDPLKNTIFSIHMYEYAGGNEAMVRENIDKTLAQGLALCIGEFGWKHSGGDVDEEAILSYCQQTNTGWLAWSWHGNSGGVEYLDLVTDPAGKTLTEWGQTIVNSTYGMMNTSVICSVFDDSDPIPTTTTTTHTTATTQTTTGTTSSTATPTTSTTTTTNTTTTNTTATTTTTPNPDGFYQKIEAEDAQMRGSVKAGSSRAGYSGTGYATGFDQSPNNGWSIEVNIPTSGHYKFTVSSAADSYKQNFLVLNGTSIATIVTQGTGEFETIVFDGIYIEAGTSILSITESWGWFDLDYIIIESGEGIKSSVYTDIDTNLSNENSNAKTKAIWDYLVENYGERVISGQYAAHNSSAEIEAIYRETGKLPALRGFDFIFMSPNTDWHCEDETQLAIDWSNQGGLVSFSWHWHSPKGPHAFYTEDTDFDLAKGVTSLDVANMPLSEVKSLYESGQITEECYLLIRDIDAISDQLAKLERNDVTVLWRPIHEASGGWFWWGNAGPDAYKWLWRTMYERQTNFHNLGNLIWVWNAQDADWYVGDEYCDIVGYDVYAEYHNYSPQTDKFAEAVDYSQGKKMVALSENAVIPDPDLLIRDNVYWSWFNVWYGDFIFDGYNLNGLYTEVDMVKKIYNHETVITLDELPNF